MWSFQWLPAWLQKRSFSIDRDLCCRDDGKETVAFADGLPERDCGIDDPGSAATEGTGL